MLAHYFIHGPTVVGTWQPCLDFTVLYTILHACRLDVLLMCPRVERCTYLRQAIVFTRARQFTMNLHYTFNNCAFARVCTYVLSTQLGVLRDELRVLSVRKCADFHENRLIYAYLSTRVCFVQHDFVVPFLQQRLENSHE